MIIFLIGYMGAGKTTIGRLLASKLNARFVDTDQLIEAEQNKSISNIFEEYGASFFRELEQQVLIRMAKSEEDLIVSTGGGMPCFHNNMDIMLRSGITIYLKCSIDDLISRVAAGINRPLLASVSISDKRTFIQQHLRERRSHYQKAIIRVWSRGDTSQVVKRIITKLKKYR